MATQRTIPQRIGACRARRLPLACVNAAAREPGQARAQSTSIEGTAPVATPAATSIVRIILYVQEIPAPGLITRCGQWQPEQNLPDIKVMKVDALEDFSIQYVDSLPGLPNKRF